MSAALDKLTAQVAANTNAEQGAIALIQGLAQEIKDLLASNPDDTVALNTLADQLATSAGALGAAVVANTPAGPATAPATPPAS